MRHCKTNPPNFSLLNQPFILKDEDDKFIKVLKRMGEAKRRLKKAAPHLIA
jgi:hypothetical protein